MSIKRIAFLSNTITKPFDRFLRTYTITHYPLDTIIDQLYQGVEEELLVILLDPKFFGSEADRMFVILHDAISAFRERHATKLLINTISDRFFEIHIADTFEQERALMALNEKIVALQEEFTDLAIIDFATLVKRYGSDELVNEKNRYLFQTPFTKKALGLLSQRIEECIELMTIPRIKAIAVDADNTLWGGIVGEEGIDKIKIDQDYPGIVYNRFQSYLKALKESGIILILLSKNDEALVETVFSTKSMPLSLDDFVAKAVNWDSKSENLAKILDTLNLTKGGVVFFDDSDTEIAAYYDERFKRERLFTTITIPADMRSSRHLYPILLDPALHCPKEDIFVALQDKGIGVQVHYKPIYKNSFYEKRFGRQSLPIAEDFYRSELSIPCHQKMSMDDAAYVADTLLEVVGKYAYRGCSF